jgi:hypothetical protein
MGDMHMAQTTRKPDLETHAETTTAEVVENKPQTWWEKHGAVVFAAGALVVVVLLVAFNIDCGGGPPR